LPSLIEESTNTEERDAEPERGVRGKGEMAVGASDGGKEIVAASWELGVGVPHEEQKRTLSAICEPQCEQYDIQIQTNRIPEDGLRCLAAIGWAVF
jgi:hypothetical protein